MSLRRIVPDNSVIIPAFFAEELTLGTRVLDISARARPIAAAIRCRDVIAFAPDALFTEFFAVAHRKAHPRTGIASITEEQFTLQFLSFAQLEITFVPAVELSAIALDLVNNAKLAPADSWYVACALLMDAELWVSHEHEDGIARHATHLGVSVRVLARQRFSTRAGR